MNVGEGDKKRAKVEQPQEETEEKSKPSEDEIGYWGEEDDALLAAMIQQEEEREQKEREKTKGNGMGKEKEKGGEEEKGEFVLEERKGDLFSAGDTYCLAHCVSEDLVMGKGVAKPFKEKFGGVNELRAQKPKTGGVCVLKRGNRWIYYLITKVFPPFLSFKGPTAFFRLYLGINLPIPL